MPGPATSSDFFKVLPARSMFVFLSAVFFTFAPTTVMMISALEPQRPALSWIWLALLSGSLAVCWAGAFSLSRWFIPGIVLFTLATAAFSGPLRDLPGGAKDGRFSWVSVSVVVSIVVGYVLFILFISGQGRTTVRLQTEMELARSIHRTLVPPLEISDGRIDALGLSRASAEMGGDLVEVVRNDRSTDLFVADVSGHGVRAGVVMGMVKSALHMGLVEQVGLQGLVGKLGHVIEATTSDELYATMAAMRIDHETLEAEYLLAGHHHVVRQRPNGAGIERLAAPGLPLGLIAGSNWQSQIVRLDPGDLLALYTDGLNETMNAADEELGHDAIERCLVEHSGRPLSEIQAALFACAESHGSQEDDRSLLLVRIRSTEFDAGTGPGSGPAAGIST